MWVCGNYISRTLCILGDIFTILEAVKVFIDDLSQIYTILAFSYLSNITVVT
jgi:hypothetical protein